MAAPDTRLDRGSSAYTQPQNPAVQKEKSDQSKKRKTITLLNKAINDHLETNTTGQELVEFIDKGLENLKSKNDKINF